VQEMQR